MTQNVTPICYYLGYYMTRRKKSRAQLRNETEFRIWNALVDYANTGAGFRRLVIEGLEWINGVDEDLQSCADIQGGATLESLAVRYREKIRTVLTWLSNPRNDVIGNRACEILEQGNAIAFEWNPENPDPKEPDSSLILEWPSSIGSVLAPLCKFVKDQIDRHDLKGEPLRDVIPVGMCARPDCGQFRVIKLYRRGRIFCSNRCKVTFHQANRTNKEKAEYMRQYRAGLDRNKPTKKRVGRRRSKTGGK